MLLELIGVAAAPAATEEENDRSRFVGGFVVGWVEDVEVEFCIADGFVDAGGSVIELGWVGFFVVLGECGGGEEGECDDGGKCLGFHRRCSVLSDCYLM